MGLLDGLAEQVLNAVAGTQHGGLMEQVLGMLQGGGLNDVVQKLQAGGLGDAVSSWISSGTNQSVSGDQIHQALGQEQVLESVDGCKPLDRESVLPIGRSKGLRSFSRGIRKEMRRGQGPATP